MRQSNTGKSDPQRPAPAKRGFLAAAGERLKRAMSGARPPDAAAVSPEESPNGADGSDSEIKSSVQAKARALLQQDRTRTATGEADGDAVNGGRSRRTSPPPLPSQRMAAEQAGASLDAVSGKAAARASTAKSKRPLRDSKSEALRARLGAAKAALAEAQAKRAAEQASAAQSEETKPELPAAVGVSDPSPPSAAEAARSDAQDRRLATSAVSDGSAAEPIRTLTIARLLARQGYFERSLSIYDELLSENADDAELRTEAERVRAQQTGEQASS